MKRGRKILNACTVFIIFMSSFSIFSSADTNMNGLPYTQSYMPVCLIYPTASQLPFGDNSLVVCYERSSATHDFYIFEPFDLTFASSDAAVTRYAYGFYVGFGSSSDVWTVNIQSGSKITHITEIVNGNVVSRSREVVGTFSSPNPTNGTSGYFTYSFTLPNPSDLSRKKIISNCNYAWGSYSVDYNISTGSFGSESDLLQTYYRADYPDSVKTAIDSISDNQTLLNQYYQSLSGKLNSLSSDHIALYNQNNELQSQVSELQSQLANQNSEFSSQLNQAQSEIQSNANAAASQAANDVNNAGEDISDINTDVDDVNSIVSKLQEWIQVLNGFADNLEDTEENVIDALESGKSLINQFFGVCPPIVIAVFGFALTFLVVRKIIGR